MELIRVHNDLTEKNLITVEQLLLLHSSAVQTVRNEKHSSCEGSLKPLITQKNSLDDFPLIKSSSYMFSERSSTFI
jgi:hypothetical protein